MTNYDFVFLLNEDKELANLKALIISLKGKIKKEENLGEKKLVYPIKKADSAKMYEWAVELTPTSMEEFKKKLSFNENLLRYLLLKGEEN